jgi:hypothetical protein
MLHSPPFPSLLTCSPVFSEEYRLREVLGSHSSEHEEHSLLRCDLPIELHGVTFQNIVIFSVDCRCVLRLSEHVRVVSDNLVETDHKYVLTLFIPCRAWVQYSPF